MKRLVLILLACVLYPASYGICDWVYYYHINEWTLLRHWLYSANIGLVGAVQFFEPGKYERMVRVLSKGLVIGFIIPNLADRLIGVYGFHWYDLGFWALATYSALKDVYPGTHKRITLIFINEKTYTHLCKWLK